MSCRSKYKHGNTWIKHSIMFFYWLSSFFSRYNAHMCLYERREMYACTCVCLCTSVNMNANVKWDVYVPVCVCVCFIAQPTESLVGSELGKKQWSMKLTRVPPWSNVTIMIVLLGTKLPSGSLAIHSILLSPNATSSFHLLVCYPFFSNMQPALCTHQICVYTLATQN